jgi:putative membrane protein
MSKIENSGQTLKYKSLIIVVSIVIPLVVLILFNIRITSLPPLTFLPPIYAAINCCPLQYQKQKNKAT